MIPVIWWNKCRGNWDHGLFMEIFDKHPDLFWQWNNEAWLNPKKYQRQIVIVAGRPDVAELYKYLSELDSGVVIMTSEEDAYFEWKKAIPIQMKIWTQYYNWNTKSEIPTRLLIGAPGRIKDYKVNNHLPKKYTWSFVGQVQNPFRQSCVEVLKTMPDGFLHIADSFGGVENGIEYQEYLDIMCQSKYVICPAGSMSVDSFRLYEAIECGAIPITDMRCPREPNGYNWWNEVYPDHKIMLIDEWSNLSPSWFDDKYYSSRLAQNEWWSNYKRTIETKLMNEANKNLPGGQPS